MRIPAAALLASLTLAAGCMPAAPKRADALSVMSAQGRNRDVKKLRLAMMFSENTKNAAAYLQKAAGTMTGRWGSVNDVAFFQSISGALEKAFATVVTVDSLEQAKAEGAHVAAIVDVYAKIGSASFTKTSAEVGAAFQSLDGAPIAVVRGAGHYRVPYPNTSLRWAEASGAAVETFALALSTNAELAEFASRTAPSAAVAAAPAAPAPAPAARSYRSDVEEPSFHRPEDASKFALVVGVEQYASLPAAEHAVRDAKALKAHLLAAGYPERNIVLLTDQQAGKSGLEKYLDAWLPKNTDEKSSVFFYFSGHGAPNPDDDQAYLVPWDGDPKFLANTGYPVKRLYERLNALKARRVLVAMDACFSGSGGRSVLAKGTRPLIAKVDLGAGTAGRVQALTASASDEITGTDEASGHGLFTYQLLKGLSAKGGRATFKELFDYLTPKVRDAARRDNRDQTPQLVGNGDASL
ncbi:MAG: caspase family protein [Elusimicrobia bacterium]|nr:caspase family protein [Elusimicrobiota bacterium]